MPKKQMDMRTLEVKPVSISGLLHKEAERELPVYDTVRRWLELQPEKTVEGCNPVRVLKKLVEQVARMEMDHQTVGIRRQASYRVGDILR